MARNEQQGEKWALRHLRQLTALTKRIRAALTCTATSGDSSNSISCPVMTLRLAGSCVCCSMSVIVTAAAACAFASPLSGARCLETRSRASEKSFGDEAAGAIAGGGCMLPTSPAKVTMCYGKRKRLAPT
jgi:hypothetical protein